MTVPARQEALDTGTAHGLAAALRRPKSTLVAVYLLAWGALLFSIEGWWWDDWGIVVSGDTIVKTFDDAGLPFASVVHLLRFGGAALYHLVSLVLLCCVGLLYYGILGTIRSLTAGERVYVAAVFLVVPLDGARQTMIVMPYTVCLALFFGAWYLLVRRAPASLGSRLAALALFLVSFTTNSLLVFFVVPLFHFWWLDQPHTIRGVVAFVKAQWWLLAAPFLFGMLKYTVFVPTGEFAGYNAFVPTAMAQAAAALVLAGLLLLAALGARHRWAGKHPWIGFVMVPAALGVLLLMLAAFPYWSVGHLPPWWDWLTRDQLLMPLGASVLALALVRAVAAWLGAGAGRAIAWLSIVVCIVGADWFGYRYWLDWQKQSEVIAALRAQPQLGEANFVVLDDQAAADNVFGNPYKYYIQTDLFTYVYGRAERIVVNDSAEVALAREHRLPLLPPIAEDAASVHVTLRPVGRKGPFGLGGPQSIEVTSTELP